jgi:hypothetical protein
MTRIQVLLSDGQNEKLSYLAGKLGTTKSGLIREAVDLFLKARVSSSADPLLELIGQGGKAGRSDISSRHDDYLRSREAERWAKRRST